LVVLVDGGLYARYPYSRRVRWRSWRYWRSITGRATRHLPTRRRREAGGVAAWRGREVVGVAAQSLSWMQTRQYCVRYRGVRV